MHTIKGSLVVLVFYSLVVFVSPDFVQGKNKRGFALPPDPGAEGKKTLLGIDTDGDGVRDDIQRYIYFTYPDDKKLRLGLTYYAKEFQASSKTLTIVRLLTNMQTRWPAMVNVFFTLRMRKQ